jgi:hypothetical protein
VRGITAAVQHPWGGPSLFVVCAEPGDRACPPIVVFRHRERVQVTAYKAPASGTSMDAATGPEGRGGTALPPAGAPDLSIGPVKSEVDRPPVSWDKTIETVAGSKNAPGRVPAWQTEGPLHNFHELARAAGPETTDHKKRWSAPRERARRRQRTTSARKPTLQARGPRHEAARGSEGLSYQAEKAKA